MYRILAAIALCYAAALWYQRSRRNNLSKPPGPPGLPLIGKSSRYPKEARSSDVQCDGGQIRSARILNDLFNQRSANYSDRPIRPLSTSSNDLYRMGLQWIFAFTSYDTRKMFHSQFQESVAPDLRPMQLKSAHDVLRRILASPDDLHVASFLMGIAYAMDLTPQTASLVQMADDVILAWSKVAVPGAYLVDALPILLIPGGGFQKEARVAKDKAMTARDIPFDMVRADMISISLMGFIMAMIVYPDVQRKAQAELDAEVGKDRLPNFDDQDSLPYCNAIVKEVLRWNPPAPLAIPHVTVNSDEYKGYHIPAQSIVIGNLWKILHDPEVYPDPMQFKPERFMASDNGGNAPNLALETFETVFGPGRRICPGRFVAAAQLFITISSLLSAFDIGPGLDADGKPIPVEPDFSYSLACHPVPFKFSITPRGRHVQELLDMAN
ncbi:cytochrome P450 [Russula compacta]|nr:cytochrome P450 [Russula compacta]